jgi:C-terminal processing protease CtpA/Prc
MHARPLALAGLLALVASACSPAPVNERARAIFGDSTGVGVTLALDRASGHWTVRRVWQDSPAARAGIVENDRVLALNGIVLPQAGIVTPCGPETVLEPLDSVRRRIDGAGDRGSLRMTLERIGTRVDFSIRRQPMAAMYSSAQSPGSTTADPHLHAVREGLPWRSEQRRLLDVRDLRERGPVQGSVPDLVAGSSFVTFR